MISGKERRMSMDSKVLIGGEDFEQVISSHSYYIDKTELIYDLFHNPNMVSLFTRPRRFGKTLNMSMIDNFFNIRKSTHSLFSHLHIMSHDDFCVQFMNQYPVIFLSFKDVEGLDFSTAKAMLKSLLGEVTRDYLDILETVSMNAFDAQIIHQLAFETIPDTQLRSSLKVIMKMLYTYYHKKVILLIDEYDVPLAKAYDHGYYRDMLDLIRSLLSTSLKSNSYLQSAVITGCLRIPKESIFTGVNNFASYSVLEPEFSKYFGFTEDEVHQMLVDFHLEKKEKLIREWYDGYLFGDTKVYCPWDVTNYIKTLMSNPETQPQNYWENTSSNSIIDEFFHLPSFTIAQKFESLLNGRSITETISNALSYDIAYTKEDHLWSVLLMTGYITPISFNQSQTKELRLPNKEIETIFQATVVNHFQKSKDHHKVQDLMNSLWQNDVKTASEIMSHLLWQTISYHDYGEDYYHAFLAGLFVRQGYEVMSNKRGLGRPDLILYDTPHRRVIIIEAKRSTSHQAMEKDCQLALLQIEHNEYALNLDGYKTILRFGIAFYKKEALIKGQ